ncbi:MAG: hypothetical protein K6E11_03675 [Bacilli bacterium]|nr:hypothetical protein [Bacilli bacterium]
MKKAKVISKLDPRFLKGIAHRGLHNDKFTENGLKAFKNAIDNDLAFEFDIHLTKDNELVVCHDENLVRTTGKDGIIEHLTLKEIKDNYRLLDGGEIPTLQEVFDINQEKVPMVIEFKVYEKNYEALTNKAKEMFTQIKDKSKVMLISFDPRSLWPFKRSGYIRSLLSTYDKEYQYVYMFRHTVESVDLDMRWFNEKKVRRYAKNHFVNAWTIENEQQLDKILPYVDTVTFQYMDKDIVRHKLERK